MMLCGLSHLFLLQFIAVSFYLDREIVKELQQTSRRTKIILPAIHSILCAKLANEKAIHALTFILTLQFVVVLSIILSNATKLVVNKKIGDTLPFVGATLAWLIAVYLYVRTIMKKRRRRKKEEESEKMKTNVAVLKEESIAIKLDGGGYGSADNKGSNEGSYEDSGIVASSSSSSSSSSSKFFKVDDKLGPVTVFTLTLMGALDELTYFPSVLIGGTFTGVDLAIGAFVSCTVILIVIAYLLSTFKPILELMDKIPLYGVVAVFATILTVEAWNENIEQG
jgi:hypothetical protein